MAMKRTMRRNQQLVTTAWMCVWLLLLVYVFPLSTRSDIGTREERFRVDPATVATLGLSTDQLRELHQKDFQLDIIRYPPNGTGVTVDITGMFDTSLFDRFCVRDMPLKCVIPIHSGVDRFAGRQLLRDSLGRLAGSLGCSIFFIVGVSVNTSVNAALQTEFEQRRDLLVMNKLDSYRDLNNKAFAMVRWIAKYCSYVPYVIHTIDDTYIDLHWFLQRLATIDEEFYMLAPMANTRVVRDYPKTSLTVNEYPFRRSPPYAYGWMYAFPGRVAQRLQAAAFTAFYCWIEDIWIGGHVRIAAGVQLIPVPRTQWRVHQFVRMKASTDRLPSVPVIHGVEIELLSTFYNRSL